MKNSINLYEIKKGQQAQILDFNNHELMLDMARFGIGVGVVIKCVEKFGNVVIQRNNQHIAIGKELSKTIIVKEFLR